MSAEREPQRSADAIVYGVGIEAMASAMFLADQGLTVVLAAPYEPWQARRLPLGGFAAHDDPAVLVRNWIGLAGEAMPPGLDWLAEQAGRWPARLSRWGVSFALADGRWRQRQLPGTDEAFALHTRDDLGAQLSAALTMQLRARLQQRAAPGRLSLLLGWRLADLIMQQTACVGVRLQRAGQRSELAAPAVVLAAELWPPWHDPDPTTLLSEIGAAALRAGATLRNIDACDLRPSWLAGRAHPIALSEAWRAEGATLWCAAAADTPRQDRLPLPEAAAGRPAAAYDAACWIWQQQASAAAAAQPPLHAFLDARARIASAAGADPLAHERASCIRAGLPDPAASPLAVAARLGPLCGGLAVAGPRSRHPFASAIAGLFGCPADRTLFSGLRGLPGAEPLLSLAAGEQVALSAASWLADRGATPPESAAKVAEDAPSAATAPSDSARRRSGKLFERLAELLRPDDSTPVAKLLKLEGKLRQQQQRLGAGALADSVLLARAMLASRRLRREAEPGSAIAIRLLQDGSLSPVARTL